MCRMHECPEGQGRPGGARPDGASVGGPLGPMGRQCGGATLKRNQEYTPNPELLKHFPEQSGNTVNGLGETERRPPSPFFWHPADIHPFGELQRFIVNDLRPARGRITPLETPMWTGDRPS